MMTPNPSNSNHKPKPNNPNIGVNEREVGWLSRAEPPIFSQFSNSDADKEFWFDVLSQFKNVRGLGEQDVQIANLLVTCQLAVMSGGNEDMKLRQAMADVAKYNKILYDRAADFERRFGDQADDLARENNKKNKKDDKTNENSETPLVEKEYDDLRGDTLGGFFA